MIGPEIIGEEKEIIINKDGTEIRRFFHKFEKCEDYLGYKYTGNYMSEEIWENNKLTNTIKSTNPFKNKVNKNSKKYKNAIKMVKKRRQNGYCV